MEDQRVEKDKKTKVPKRKRENAVEPHPKRRKTKEAGQYVRIQPPFNGKIIFF